VPHIQGISLERIMSAIIQGTQEAYKDQGLAYCTISLPEISPFFIGQYLQYAMLEIIYVADLLALDPFNQPQVELYKSHTRKILAHE
jgi:glucose-6-phosphate isomerase